VRPRAAHFSGSLPIVVESRFSISRPCVVSCPGVLEDRVWFVGLWALAQFDGSKVFSVQHHDANGVVVDPPPEIPEEVCRALPRGCTCSSELCKPSEALAANPAQLEARCSADDAECGPEAFSHTCLDWAGYRPRAPRRIVMASALRSQSCSYDGECANSGCGYQCLSLRNPRSNESFLCIKNFRMEALLADAFCGCVEGTCAWFAQR
jgi:hypothetical protein